METDKFLASVQYNDWVGTSAADSADRNKLHDWLKSNGHMEENEFLIGINFFAGENHGKHNDPIYVHFLFAVPGDHDSVKATIDSSQGPIKVRNVSVDMNLTDFFGLFKRFSVAFSAHGMLDQKEYTFED